jgi:hypothetical protein
MRIELWILTITGFVIFNAYHDGKYTKMLLSYKKYYQMIFYGVVGLSIYLLLKRNPVQSKNMLLYANNMVKYMPIDRSTMDLITPIIDFTREDKSFMESFNDIEPSNYKGEKMMMQSGKNGTKRSVSETKKKYVASIQDWKCAHCGSKLTAWYEVDHKIRLEYGGGNDVQNLVALCRDCHGKKTAMENM